LPLRHVLISVRVRYIQDPASHPMIKRVPAEKFYCSKYGNRLFFSHSKNDLLEAKKILLLKWPTYWRAARRRAKGGCERVAGWKRRKKQCPWGEDAHGRRRSFL